MKKEIRFSIILASGFLFSSLVTGVVLGVYSLYLERESLVRNTQTNLEEVAILKSEQVQEFLEATKARVVDFSSDGLIKNSLVKINNEFGSIQTMENLSNHLIVNKLPIEKDFYGVIVLDVNGKVVGTTNPKEDFGTDFSDNHMFLMGIKQPHLMEVMYDEGFGHKGIAISAPVLKEEKPLGVVVIKIQPDSFYGITSGGIKLGETGEIYIINKDKFLITPSRFLEGEGGVLVQKIDDENSRACFDEGVIGHPERDEPAISFLDYRGEEVIGTHREVLDINWCLVAKIDKSEAIDRPLKNYILNQVIVSALVIATITLSGFAVGSYLDRRYEFKKGKEVNVNNK